MADVEVADVVNLERGRMRDNEVIFQCKDVASDIYIYMYTCNYMIFVEMDLLPPIAVFIVEL